MSMNNDGLSWWSSFISSGKSELWESDFLWLNVVSDVFIALAFVLIIIFQYVVQRSNRDSHYRPVIIMFSIFIAASCLMHFAGILTVWRGEYDILGFSKALAAVVTMSVAIILIISLRKLPALRGPEELRALNIALQDKIDAQNKATEKLAATEKRLSAFLKQAPDAMVIVAETGEIEYSNDMMNALFGYSLSGLDGKNVQDLLPKRLKHKIGLKHNDLYATDDASTWNTSKGEFTAIRKDGTEFSAEVRINRVPTKDGTQITYSTYRDISERKTNEANKHKDLMELAHVSRMSTVDQMATGLAHELNQPLTAMSNNLFTAISLLKKLENIDPIMLKMAQENYASVQRAGQIIKSLRRLVSKDDSYQCPTDINSLMINTTELIRPEARMAGVMLSLNLKPDLPDVNVDPVQIQQVLVNLGRNAIEAFSTQTLYEQAISMSTERYSDAMVLVTVSDNGPGLTEQIKAELFSPNITSKEKGMGLGLSICLSIIKAQGGELWHLDDQRQGATFCFTVPLVQAIET